MGSARTKQQPLPAPNHPPASITSFADEILNAGALEVLSGTAWRDALCASITGDASTRRYFRLRHGVRTAVLMDASLNLECVKPFVRIAAHLRALGFSAPEVLGGDESSGVLLLEDFGDDTFARLLDGGRAPDELFALAVDLLASLHANPDAIPGGLRRYHPERMLEDIELLLEWRTPAISEDGKKEFREAWLEVLPIAHRVPASLLLRDFHVANLMWLAGRKSVRRGGLLDFQDAYQGPVTYDLVSLLQDARRDVSGALIEKMIARYLERFPALDRETFDTSMAILAAQRHTRVLAIFERLSRLEGRHDYKRQHSPRVERLLRRALTHPALVRVKRWFERHAA